MLKPEECVLVIVDVQGKLAQIMDNSDKLHQQLQTLIQGAQLFEIPILWLEQLPDKLGATSTELQTLLAKTSSPIAKQHFSGWHCDAFAKALTKTNRKHVIVAGIETHVCVYQTCCDLIEQQYSVHLVADCVSSRSAENKQLGIQMMTARGALLTNVESLLFELQHQAQGERFRALLKLIK
ncbi:hydrolase [Shewanella sp. SM101]|uniref:hydrolase n=1 Tax=Shewanella TaxID=22 RepID=UPI0021DAD26C|nr:MULTISPECIES: hydrolase [unclassified Shewanella]MCU7985412.1 hydrolase [Shewanella sp. SW24]MCU8008868.1 hydrolase [Shewanella sp. SM87]MCU8023578.1 hydrolase [Shewanella sp. SM78]MCU8035261.1 hydrolase [Shewanella sp. SM71]MCU8080615.1 hydrolase [Shewanella sp. SM103]